MKKCIVIDTQNKRIYESKFVNLGDLQKVVDGSIETAHSFNNGDVIFVNEEGMFREDFGLFTIEGTHQPFKGNGIMVGSDENGNSIDVDLDLFAVKMMVKFL